MIESKTKRQCLLETVEHWANHTKIMSYLRDYDIPSLVEQIIDEFYPITLSCGCQVNSMGEEIPLTTKDRDSETGSPAICYGTYCVDCAKWYEKKKLVLHTQKEENEYLQGVAP